MFQKERKSQSSGKRIVVTFTELDLTGKTILKLEAALPLTLFETDPVPESFSFNFYLQNGMKDNVKALNYSKRNTPSSGFIEFYSLSYSKEFTALYKLKFQYRVPRSLPLVAVLSQVSAVHILIQYSITIHLILASYQHLLPLKQSLLSQPFQSEVSTYSLYIYGVNVAPDHKQ